MKAAVLFITLVVCFNTPIYAQHTIGVSSSVQLLQGMDTSSSELRPICVEADGLSDEDQTETTLTVDEVKDSESIYRAVQSSAAAEFGIGIGSKVSASFGMSSDKFFETGTTVFMVGEKVITSRRVSRLPYKVIAPYDTLPEAQFENTCGNEFVTELVYGGQFMVLLRATHISEGEKNTFKADMKLAMGPNNASVAYQQATDRVRANSSFQLHLVRQGANGDLPILNPTELLEYARTFQTKIALPSTTAKDPTLTISGTDGHNVPSITFDKERGNLTFVTTSPYVLADKRLIPDLAEALRQSILYDLAGRFNLCLGLNRQINHVLETNREFAFNNKAQEISELEKAAAETAVYCQAIPAKAAACLTKNSTTCTLASDKPVPTVNLPKLLTEAGGGCYEWTTPDNRYCTDFRVHNRGGTVVRFSAPMKPNNFWRVRATGFPRIATPNGYGDVRLVNVAVVLKAGTEQTSSNKSIRYNAWAGFDLAIPKVSPKDGVIPVEMTVTQCEWAGDQACDLDAMSVEISPSSDTSPVPHFPDISKIRVAPRNE